MRTSSIRKSSKRRPKQRAAQYHRPHWCKSLMVQKGLRRDVGKGRDGTAVAASLLMHVHHFLD